MDIAATCINDIMRQLEDPTILCDPVACRNLMAKVNFKNKQNVHNLLILLYLFSEVSKMKYFLDILGGAIYCLHLIVF